MIVIRHQHTTLFWKHWEKYAKKPLELTQALTEVATILKSSGSEVNTSMSADQVILLLIN